MTSWSDRQRRASLERGPGDLASQSPAPDPQERGGGEGGGGRGMRITCGVHSMVPSSHVKFT